MTLPECQCMGLDCNCGNSILKARVKELEEGYHIILVSKAEIQRELDSLYEAWRITPADSDEPGAIEVFSDGHDQSFAPLSTVTHLRARLTELEATPETTAEAKAFIEGVARVASETRSAVLMGEKVTDFDELTALLGAYGVGKRDGAKLERTAIIEKLIECDVAGRYKHSRSDVIEWIENREET